ncbi:hypothetical protein J4E86_001601 [Alternaria arbusti]|uniref:uncharacterized protein n=1 Tax=Alternaria arbusti TaxID=232088 RepID=UPI00221F77F7|nr:uncharacterized protein J4E86_001601 [Alternaria arbusti]KAI4959983.1 hypothetical protein J4E86_001601 [Alternaria arbusti]
MSKMNDARDTSNRDTSHVDESADGVLEFCHGYTKTAMNLDVKGCGWRLYLLLSRHFQWKNGDVSGESRYDDDQNVATLSFELLITRRSVPSSSVANRTDVPELIVVVEASPNGCGIRSLQTLYRVIPSESPSGRLNITANTSPGYKLDHPWKLGFDFDMSRDRIEPDKKYGTCVIFSQEEPSEGAKSGWGEGAPEAVLLGDGDLEVDDFADLGDEKAISYSYNNVSLWRLAAVGYRK